MLPIRPSSKLPAIKEEKKTPINNKRMEKHPVQTIQMIMIMKVKTLKMSHFSRYLYFEHKFSLEFPFSL